MKPVWFATATSLAGAVALFASLPGCSKTAPAPVTYASYEDCVLGKLGRGQSTVASTAIIEACRAKFADRRPAAAANPHAGLFDDVLQGHPVTARGEDVPDQASDPAWELARAEQQSERFYGKPCTVDCSGHEAGYAWAEENEITDPDECGGNSQSFIDGCEAWAEGHAE